MDPDTIVIEAVVPVPITGAKVVPEGRKHGIKKTSVVMVRSITCV